MQTFASAFNASVLLASLIAVPIVNVGALGLAMWRLQWRAAVKLAAIFVVWLLVTVYVLIAEVFGCMGGGCADGSRDFPLSVFYLAISLGAAIAAIAGLRKWAPPPGWADTSLTPKRLDSVVRKTDA